MATLAQVGETCPNPSCREFGRHPTPTARRKIIKFGTTPQGRQRYRCPTCGKTFVDSKGTLFYRRRTGEKEILETLALLADGTSPSSLARATGHKEETILEWLKEAGQQAQALEEVLLAEYQVGRGQLDALWSFVGHKGEKRGTPKARRRAPSGGRR
jgi:transposase-like protein